MSMDVRKETKKMVDNIEINENYENEKCSRKQDSVERFHVKTCPRALLTRLPNLIA